MEEKKYLVIDGKQTHILDLTGQQFGRLTVIEFYEKRNGRPYWKCSCKINPNYKLYAQSEKIKNERVSCQSCLGCKVNNRSDRYRQSFYQWCLENNHQDYLDLWDYKLNKKSPDEISYGSHSKIYFKCPLNNHNSELKKLKNVILCGIVCTKCNSFAQWGIDNICSDFIEKYWDYDKNTVDPWQIPKTTHNKIWIRCQEKEHHESYEITCANFYRGNRCPYCINRKVHKLDSVGTLSPKIFKVWSDKNKKSPYEIASQSGKKYWFKCQNGIHKDYMRTMQNSFFADFYCPECNSSKGENRVSEFLINNNIDYEIHKEFEGLIGLGSGLLSYDFYLNKLNLLIEYQGEQHEKFIKGMYVTYENFEKQVEHDKRKREYAGKNNINLLEIWYYDFDNIEEILKTELKLN